MPDLAAVERTALLTAALRAAESRGPDHLYSDPYAEAFAGEIGPGLLDEIRAVTFPPERDRTLPSTPDYNAIRTRFFDDFLTGVVDDPGMRQLVIAPAGMDSRALRLDWPGHVTLFEVDRPAVVDVKEQVLGDEVPGVERRVVAVDLRAPDWEARLADAGYEPAQPSTWLLEGLLYYIPEADARRILDRVRALSAPGSRIAADVVNAAALRLPNMTGLLDVFARWGCPRLFGTDEPEEFFARHGFSVQPGEPGADYGRWPDPVPPRTVTDVRRVFFVHGTSTVR